MKEKSIILIPGQQPKLVGRWRLGEIYEVLQIAKLWLDSQEIEMKETQEEGDTEQV